MKFPFRNVKASMNDSTKRNEKSFVRMQRLRSHLFPLHSIRMEEKIEVKHSIIIDYVMCILGKIFFHVQLLPLPLSSASSHRRTEEKSAQTHAGYFWIMNIRASKKGRKKETRRISTHPNGKRSRRRRVKEKLKEKRKSKNEYNNNKRLRVSTATE